MCTPLFVYNMHIQMLITELYLCLGKNTLQAFRQAVVDRPVVRFTAPAVDGVVNVAFPVALHMNGRRRIGENTVYAADVELEFYLEDSACDSFLLKLKEAFAARISALETDKKMLGVAE